jgi:hypothetical protein
MVEDRSTLEVSVVGAEGMVGISVFLCGHASLNQALAPCAGAGMSMKADAMETEKKPGEIIEKLSYHEDRNGFA